MRRPCLDRCEISYGNDGILKALSWLGQAIASGIPTAFGADIKSRVLCARKGKKKHLHMPLQPPPCLPPSVGLLEEHLAIERLLAASGPPPAHQAERQQRGASDHREQRGADGGRRGPCKDGPAQ